MASKLGQFLKVSKRMLMMIYEHSQYYLSLRRISKHYFYPYKKRTRQEAQLLLGWLTVLPQS